METERKELVSQIYSERKPKAPASRNVQSVQPSLRAKLDNFH